MVRLADLPDYEREHLLGKCLPPIAPPAWVENSKPLKDKRIALITTAGLHFRDDAAFEFADETFRAIPGDEDAGNLIMSLVDPASTVLTAFVLERDAAGVAEGSEARVTIDARPGHVFKGRVKSIAEISRPIERNSPVK